MTNRELLIAFRKRYGLTQRRVGEILGVSPQAVGAYEDGRLKLDDAGLHKVFIHFTANPAIFIVQERLITTIRSGGLSLQQLHRVDQYLCDL